MGSNVARRDTSNHTAVPNIRSLQELKQSGQNGNIDDASLASEISSILALEIEDLKESETNAGYFVYEMYMPFIRGHYDNTIEIPKTKLLRWIKKVSYFIV